MAQKSIRSLLAAAGLIAAVSAQAAQPESCAVALAATRSYSLGGPVRATPTPDGSAILFLRSGPRDTKLGLYIYDLQTKALRPLAMPERGPEHLSVEEKALRERARMTLTGITDYSLSRDGKTVLVAQADHLSIVSLPDGAVHPVPGNGWIGAKLSPDGTHVAGVRNNDLHVVDLATGQDRQITTGGTDILTHGLPEFAAAEELDRTDGFWWSPDSNQILYEEADSSGVEKHFIADPEHPSVQPVEFRYPRAGTANAKLRFGVIGRDGGDTVWIDWDRDAYPYVARAVWPRHGALSLVLLNRPQTSEQVVAVDPRAGTTRTLLTDTDPAWLNLTPSHGLAAAGAKPLPYWLDDGSGFLWAAERNGIWQLELHRADGSLDHAVTPQDLPYDALDDVDPATKSVVVVATSADRLSTGIYRVPLAGGAPKPVSVSPGLHDAVFNDDGHTLMIDHFSRADGGAGSAVLTADGHLQAMLPSVAERPPSIPKVQFLTTGPLQFDTALIRPHDFKAGQHYPVVLSVYAGPTVKLVHRAPRLFLEDQCLADQGFIVATLDVRGTPGRNRDWERATKNDLIDIPLNDQVSGLLALGRQFPEMDVSRAGVTGWSFGGYFTAMATIRRPDVFRAGVAGAPVVDWQDYDTAYTERYLGMPDTSSNAYKVSNVLTYAANLQRPLLIMHGLTDDNVYFGNTVKLTQALIAAGKPYNLLLLPGTHLLPDPLLRARVDEARARFLKVHLQAAGH